LVYHQWFKKSQTKKNNIRLKDDIIKQIKEM